MKTLKERIAIEQAGLDGKEIQVDYGYKGRFDMKLSESKCARY